MQFTVYIPELWYHEVAVEAESAEEALVKVKAGTYDDSDSTTYSHQLEDGETVVPCWEVEPNPPDAVQLHVRER